MTTTLGGATLPYDPNQISWGYTLNVSSQDTLGGRVVQLLSVKLDTVTLAAESGDLHNLLQMFEQMEQIMQFHVDQHLPVRLDITTKGWSFDVYVTDLPSFQWDVSSTSYPYQLTLEIEDDLTGIVTTQILQTELNNLASGIGYNQTYQGGQQQTSLVLPPDSTGASPTAPYAPPDLPTDSTGRLIRNFG